MEIIDITLKIDRKVLFPWQDLPNIILTKNLNQWDVCTISTINNLNSHLWTHVDFPSHILKQWKKNLDFSIDNFLWDALLVEVVSKNKSIRDLLKNIDIQGKIILVKTKKKNIWFEKDFFSLRDTDVKYLVKSKIKAVWIDTMSIDWYWKLNFPNHNLLLKNNILIYEWLDLSKALAWSYFFVWLPLKFQWLEASLVRAILIKS